MFHNRAEPLQFLAPFPPLALSSSPCISLSNVALSDDVISYGALYISQHISVGRLRLARHSAGKWDFLETSCLLRPRRNLRDTRVGRRSIVWQIQCGELVGAHGRRLWPLGGLEKISSLGWNNYYNFSLRWEFLKNTLGFAMNVLAQLNMDVQFIFRRLPRAD